MNAQATPTSTIERFEIIGRGTLATVYDGYDHSLERFVAIKEIRESLRTQPEPSSAFWGEATFLARLNHPNIVRVHGIDRQRGWIMLERMQSSLADEAAKGPVSGARVRDILKQVLSAIQYIHSLEKIHGQIRLDKILVDEQGNLKLADLLGSDIEGEFRKPDEKQLHIAPEILNPKHFGQPGLNSDLYCVGIVALQLLTGPKFIKMFKGMERKRNQDPIAWSAWHASAEPIPSVATMVPKLPSDLVQLIDGLVQKQAGLRFCSASEALGVLSTTKGQDSSENNPSINASALIEPSSQNTLNATYTSPDIYSPTSTRISNAKGPGWKQVLNRYLSNNPWLFERKFQIQALVIGVCMLGVTLMLLDSGDSNLKAEDTIESASAVPETTTSDSDEAPTIIRDPIEFFPPKGKVKMILRKAPNGPEIEIKGISIDGQRVDFKSDPIPNELDESEASGSGFVVTRHNQQAPLEIVAPIGSYDLRIDAEHYLPHHWTMEISDQGILIHEAQFKLAQYDVEFKITPEDAVLAIDDVLISTHSGSSLRKVHLPMGSHHVKVEANGFNTQSKFVMIDKQQKEKIQLIPIEIGAVTIDSFPRGAIVAIDGEFVGLSPCTWRGLLGKHKVRMEMEGFGVLESDFSVKGSSSAEPTRLCWYLTRSEHLLAKRTDADNLAAVP